MSLLDNTLVFVSGMFTASAFELGTIKEITGTGAKAQSQTPHEQTQVQNMVFLESRGEKLIMKNRI